MVPASRGEAEHSFQNTQFWMLLWNGLILLGAQLSPTWCKNILLRTTASTRFTASKRCQKIRLEFKTNLSGAFLLTFWSSIIYQNFHLRFIVIFWLAMVALVAGITCDALELCPASFRTAKRVLPNIFKKAPYQTFWRLPEWTVPVGGSTGPPEMASY